MHHEKLKQEQLFVLWMWCVTSCMCKVTVCVCGMF